MLGVNFVSPEVGSGNDYWHLHQEALERLQKVSKVYRTNLEGTITITTDGSAYSVPTQKTEPVKGARSTTSETVA